MTTFLEAQNEDLALKSTEKLATSWRSFGSMSLGTPAAIHLRRWKITSRSLDLAANTGRNLGAKYLRKSSGQSAV